jgi:acetyl-CoA C-acetyltransferase
MKQVYICAATRTPIGSFLGSLSSFSAVQLAIIAAKAVILKSGIEAQKIEQVILGNVLSAGLGQAPARQVLIGAGISKSAQAMTINKVCSSGLKAVMLAANEIAISNSEAIIAGGTESMSNAPFLNMDLRKGRKLGHATLQDTLLKDALWDVYNDFHMGNAAELCAKKYSFSRIDQDNYAIESYQRAQKAITSGYFKEEITPVQVVIEDEEPGKAKLEKISTLKPAFDQSGTITAANASSINDGASLMLVCSEDFAKKNNMKPLARIVSQASFGQDPEWFTTAPIGALNSALSKAGMKISEIDLFEINEAFSAVALACQKELEIDSSVLNINGGAVALGHPVGASGARILTTLVHSLIRTQKRYGAVAICNGGGEATSLIVERL